MKTVAFIGTGSLGSEIVRAVCDRQHAVFRVYIIGSLAPEVPSQVRDKKRRFLISTILGGRVPVEGRVGGQRKIPAFVHTKPVPVFIGQHFDL